MRYIKSVKALSVSLCLALFAQSTFAAENKTTPTLTQAGFEQYMFTYLKLACLTTKGEQA